MQFELIKSFVPKKAFDVLKDAETSYKQEGLFSSEVLEILHSYFDEPLVQATELMEKSRVICYTTANSYRKIYEISTTQERYAIFKDTNFCHCNFFKRRVLETRSSLTCKHVLAVYLTRITGNVKEEELSQNIFEEYLNAKLYDFLDVDTQELIE